MKLRFAFLFLTVTFSACVTKNVFVVSRDVPDSPSFVVIPANDYLSQVEFANTIESYLIACHVRVLAKPGTKQIESTKQAAQSGAQPAQAAATQATLTERFVAFDETNADYIVQTYSDTQQLKIIKKATTEVLATFELKYDESHPPAEIIRNALISLGVKAQ